tara:strand:- start:2204 stop:2929 length:726 start_codon:yes stop_codon:yes gene_type:complete
MSYQVFNSGVVGPSDQIGGSSPYHIDSKFATSLGESEARKMFEEKVKKYNSIGRSVEFSNQGVGGSVYDMNASDEDRAALFKSAYSAHAPREGFYSLDYYAPKQGHDRFHKSAESAPIFGVAPTGGSNKPGVGGNYGYHNMVYNSAGDLIAKVGHGDKSKAGSLDGQTFAATNDEGETPALGADADPTNRAEAKEKAQSYQNMSKSEMDSAYDAMRSDTARAETEGMKMHEAYFNKPKSVL